MKNISNLNRDLFDKRYKFTQTWFDMAINGWVEILQNKLPNSNVATNPSKYKNVLEIGSYEGRASIWLAENILQDGCNYHIIDTFGGTLKESGMEATKNKLETNSNFIEENLRHNISFFPNINWNITKGYSQTILPELVNNNSEPVFDLVYVDGSHQADDTFVDGYYVNKLLRPGGLIIFDDYNWIDSTPEKQLFKRKLVRQVMNVPNIINDQPEIGIDTFFDIYKDLYKVIHASHQVFAIKK